MASISAAVGGAAAGMSGTTKAEEEEEEVVGREATGAVAAVEWGGKALPHPDKVHKGGEDAFFVSDDGQTLGVADGVGGWASLGIDPGVFAKRLMAGCISIAPITSTHATAPGHHHHYHIMIIMQSSSSSLS